MAVARSVIEAKAQNALRVLAQRTRVRAAYLFGSHVSGTADEWSDIDVAAFVEDAATWDLGQRVAICVEARRVAGDDVELHLFPTDALANPPRAGLAQYALRHGIPLNIEGVNTTPY